MCFSFTPRYFAIIHMKYHITMYPLSLHAFLGMLPIFYDFGYPILYGVGPHPMSSLHIYTFVVSWAFMADAASQAGDADYVRAHCLTSDCRGP